MVRPVRRDFVGPNGNLRVRHYATTGRAKADVLPETSVEIGVRYAGRGDYIGTSRWGRTWTEVETTTGIAPLDDPRTVND